MKRAPAEDPADAHQQHMLALKESLLYVPLLARGSLSPE
jgi:hypothetical protein